MLEATPMISIVARDYYRATGKLTPKLEAELNADLKFFRQERFVHIAWAQAQQVYATLKELGLEKTPVTLREQRKRGLSHA